MNNEINMPCGGVCTQEECNICNDDCFGGNCTSLKTDAENIQAAIKYYDQREVPFAVYIVEALQEKAEREKTPDVVEVVRCKDCKHFSPRASVNFCGRHGGMIAKNSYCRYGKRTEREPSADL